MSLPSGAEGLALWAVQVLACAGYALAAASPPGRSAWAASGMAVGVLAHAGWLAAEMAASISSGLGVRLGFGPVTSLTACLVLVVHAVESRFVQLPAVRRVLAVVGGLSVLVAMAFPGELRLLGSPWAPVHWLLGVAAYGLFGAAVLHALLLDGADRRLRMRRAGTLGLYGMPLLQLERLTFVFVQAGFVVLSAAIALGVFTTAHWRWDHKTVLSLLGWTIFAALLAGRRWRGWRGQRATRWLYAGTVVLLLAYVGSRFVMEVLLGRPMLAGS